jgi:hypothetical protein
MTTQRVAAPCCCCMVLLHGAAAWCCCMVLVLVGGRSRRRSPMHRRLWLLSKYQVLSTEYSTVASSLEVCRTDARTIVYSYCTSLYIVAVAGAARLWLWLWLWLWLVYPWHKCGDPTQHNTIQPTRGGSSHNHTVAKQADHGPRHCHCHCHCISERCTALIALIAAEKKKS